MKYLEKKFITYLSQITQRTDRLTFRRFFSAYYSKLYSCINSNSKLDLNKFQIKISLRIGSFTKIDKKSSKKKSFTGLILEK